MSRNRTRKDAGYCNEAKLPKGPSGRNLCRQCATEVPKGRRTFCSSECVDAWKWTTDPAFVRAKVWDRDRGVCANCDRDTEMARRRALNMLRRWTEWKRGRPTALKRLTSAAVNRFGRGCWARAHTSWWDADHITPVDEGGGECGLDNYQTLCLPCHRLKTATQAARKAGRRMATGQLVVAGMRPTPAGRAE
ncbi:hypothetical protein LCGC14_2816610 [marine sediment metagenome]|uniref:HNH nuclease domain-containing protein n=1 Tax=marine sediment metagenome TaxID=412755 RepID=A0A0F8Z531_9ZZZZ